MLYELHVPLKKTLETSTVAYKYWGTYSKTELFDDAITRPAAVVEIGVVCDWQPTITTASVVPTDTS